MDARIATGLAVDDAGVDAFAEAAGRAALELGGARPDLTCVFAGEPNLTHVEEGLAAVSERTGARPIGPEMVVTDAEENTIVELASKPALERLKEAIAELDFEERALAARGLLLGVVIDENKPAYGRGDFLIRGLLAVDDAAGTLTVGERVRVGQTVRLQVRDGESADEDLREALERQAGELPAPPAGALVFTCNGRGRNMFSAPDHDAVAIDDAFRGAPAAGFFCAGEIGPVGGRNFVHGFTATVAVFAGES